MQLKKESTAVDNADPLVVATSRAVGYLSKNLAGSPDAARALLLASGKGYDVGSTLDATIVALKQPMQWPAGERVHFAAALAAAERIGKAASTDLEAAAKLLVADQQSDGSYGSVIDSWLARLALIASGMQPDNFTIVQIDKFIRSLTVESLDDALGAVLGLELASDVMAENLRRTSLGIIRQQQRDSGAFGAEDGPPPIAETVWAVLALSMLDAEPRLARSTYRPEELKAAIAGGKKFLAAQQKSDGSWPGPPAMTAWALTALLSGL